jgi:predicted transcriptional regulator of viral defense system
MTVDVRTLPRTLATIAAELELDEASYVTIDRIADIAHRHGIASEPRNLAYRLRKSGWLLDTPSRGVWEFAPAVNAGPYGRGDTFALLRGLLDRRSMAGARVCLVSSLWLRGLSERPPSRHEICLPPGTRAPVGLKAEYRVVHFDPHLPHVRLRGLPVEAPATTLTHLAAHPVHVTSWEAIVMALPNLAAKTTADELRIELKRRPPTVAARLGYLLEGVAPQLVREADLRPTATVTRYGPTHAHGRFNSRWNIADSLLPVDPTTLDAAAPQDLAR